MTLLLITHEASLAARCDLRLRMADGALETVDTGLKPVKNEVA